VVSSPLIRALALVPLFLSATAHAEQAEAAAALDRLLPWGSGAEQLGYRPALPERRAQGPSAVAVDATGTVHVLDRLKGRVLRLDAGSRATPVVAASVPVDCMDMAAAAQLVVYSPLRARAWIFSAGKQVASLEVPRSLRELRGVGLGDEGGLSVHTAYQETYRISSSAEALPLSSILHSKREGAVLLEGGDGLAVQRQVDGRPALLHISNGAGRSRVEVLTVLDQPVLAARVIGATGDLVCLRLERAAAGPGLQVRREVACLSLSSARVQFSRALPPAHGYLPRRDLALGGGQTPRLVFINPEPAGLRVLAWDLPATAKGGAR